jgi:intraflagellar transport protein 172
VTIKPIKGDVEEIERGNGKTIVIVDEGIDRVEYPLDEALISFSTAIDEGDAILALSILDHLELVDGVEEMWRQLYKFSIDNDNLPVAIKCATILNDPATATYLSKLNETMEKLLKDSNIDISDHYYFRAKMALLRKDLATAEQEYLNHDKVDECIEMYQSLFKYESAIRVAEQTHHPNEYDMKRQYYNYLLETKQFEVAAQMKEKNGDYTQAIDLYLKGNMPAKAARIVLNRKIYQPITLLDSILQSLNRQGLHDISGEFYEFQDDFSHAIDSYERGNAYRKAVELARKCFPGRVVELQEKWGDYLVSQRQIDMALNHYIEAKAYQKAIEAALSARQYNRALQLVKAIDEKFSKPYYLMLARYYEESSQIELAEKCFIAGGDYAAAVNMHANLGNWEIVSKLASAYMNEGEIGLMYLNHAQNMESQGRLKDAEKLYLSVRESDMAISMYKKHKRYDEMIRLVKDHRPELLKEVCNKIISTSFISYDNSIFINM